MRITVIMPVYNAEKDLHHSIDSLIRQTSNSWELICVDDGSTDSSRQIIEEYCKKDSRIRMICQNNSGPAVARANAITQANTEYIAILDSDDSYSDDFIEKVIERAIETDADSIVPNVWFGKDGIPIRQNLFSKGSLLKPDMIINDGKEAFSLTIPWMLHGWQVVKTSLAKEYYTVDNASYSKFNSDEYITRLLYLKSKKTALCNACYKHTISSTSITHTASLKQLDYLITLDKLCNLCKKENVDIVVVSRLLMLYHNTLSYCYDIVLGFSNHEQKEGFKIINEFYNKSYKKYMTIRVIMQFPAKTRIKLLMSLINFHFINSKGKKIIAKLFCPKKENIVKINSLYNRKCSNLSTLFTIIL